MPQEREALLPSSSHSPDSSPPRTPSQARLPRQTTSYLFTAGLVIFSAVFTSTLFLLLLGYSFKPSEAELATLPTTAFAYSGPESIHVLDITDHGVLVNVTVRLGIDADLALGTKTRSKGDREDAAGRGERGLGVGWWEKIRRWTARQALAQLPQQAVNVVFPESIDIFPAHFSSPPLLSLSVNQTVPVPLVLDVDSKKNWLQPVSFVALARPMASGPQLWEYIQTTWMQGQVKVVVSVPTVEVGLPEGVWWSKYGQLEKQDLTMDLNLDSELSSGALLMFSPASLCRVLTMTQYRPSLVFPRQDTSSTYQSWSTSTRTISKPPRPMHCQSTPVPRCQTQFRGTTLVPAFHFASHFSSRSMMARPWHKSPHRR